MQDVRTCPVTGLKVQRDAENLIKLNAVMAVVLLLIGGIGALLLALTRWEAIHLLPADLYYRFLTIHGMNMLVFWIVFFECAGLVFASTIVLNARQVAPKYGYLAFLLMLLGWLMVNYIVFTGNFSETAVMFTAYVPLKAHPLFYLGYILFAVGALIFCILFFLNVYNARRERTFEGPVPLFTYGIAAAAVIAVFTLIHGALAFIPVFLWSLDIVKEINPAVYRLIFWGFGHPAQQINLAAMISVWYLLSYFTVGGITPSEKVSRTAFLLYVLFINAGSAHHLLVDPAYGTPWKIFNTSYVIYLAVLASLIHCFAIPASVEIGQRSKGFNNGLFTWLIKAPWGNPAFAAFFISLVLFGFVGGTSGVIMGVEQINMKLHNTLGVPGHFHGTVAAGTSLAFMGLAYYVVPLIFRREWLSKFFAIIQPYLFGIGLGIMALSMNALGRMGIPRRTWETTLLNVPHKELFEMFLGIGAIIAFTGLIIFVLHIVLTLLFGKKFTDNNKPTFPAISEPATSKTATPGTIVLAFIFFIYLIIMFIFNWYLLSKAWEVR
jgi:cytochrome c oxidase subunit I